MSVAVIGAGPAGITAAYELAKGGMQVEVFEAGDAVGGMARTIELWGQKVDLGPHRFFSTDDRVNHLWFEVAGEDYHPVDRLTRIYYRNRFFHYPLQAGNALRNMGLLQAARCTASYLREKIAPTCSTEEAEDFESWVVGRFGRRLFEMFFKSYSEKLWGIPCRELDADFAAQRIKKFSLGEAIKSALGLSRGKHKTLVDQFAYPTGGTGMIYERMAREICRHGGKVHLQRPVRRVLHSGGRVDGLVLADGERRPFEHVISTMPLTLLVRGLGDLPPAVRDAVDSLSYRNTILVYLLADGVDLFPDQWLYVHSPDLLVGRVTNFRNWVPELYGDARTSILTLEYWCNRDDAFWEKSDGELVALAGEDIDKTGLVAKASVLDGHVIRLARSYPVYRRGYRDHLAKVVAYLERFQGLTAIGRYGAFKYNNQDHSILMGILAAENILDGRNHLLWTINTDYESYQEAGRAMPAKRAA
jgi:protoporphyrinogen oxidase